MAEDVVAQGLGGLADSCHVLRAVGAPDLDEVLLGGFGDVEIPVGVAAAAADAESVQSAADGQAREVGEFLAAECDHVNGFGDLDGDFFDDVPVGVGRVDWGSLVVDVDGERDGVRRRFRFGWWQSSGRFR